jgi:hypothetical protein
MEVPYYRIKDRGDIYLVVHEKGKWIGAFQASFYGCLCESKNWNILFSNKKGMREFTQKEKYFLLETKEQSIQRNMERDALHMILRKVTGDPCFTTKIMDLL